MAVLVLHRAHNAEVASISENATKNQSIFNDVGSAAAQNRSQIGQLQFWKSHCRSGNSHISGLHRLIFIMLANAPLGGAIPAADLGSDPRIDPKLFPPGCRSDPFGASLTQNKTHGGVLTSNQRSMRTRNVHVQCYVIAADIAT